MKNIYKNMCNKQALNMNKQCPLQLPQSYDATSDSESMFSYKENRWASAEREPT